MSLAKTQNRAEIPLACPSEALLETAPQAQEAVGRLIASLHYMAADLCGMARSAPQEKATALLSLAGLMTALAEEWV